MRAALLLAGAVLAAGCGEPFTGPLPEGDWGGDHVGLVLTTTGGDVEFDCGYGTLDEPLMVVRGRFEVTGLHYPGGGPVGKDPPLAEPAVYAGTVSGGHMVLTVTLTKTGNALGPYDLWRGRSPNVFKCL